MVIMLHQILPGQGCTICQEIKPIIASSYSYIHNFGMHRSYIVSLSLECVYACAVEYQVSTKKHRLDENIASCGEFSQKNNEKTMGC